MAEITAKLVNELRSKTGQGMMECKKALKESDGDMDQALEYFRKKGVKASLTERAATEGQVIGAVAADATVASLVELNCNTDFTAKSDPLAAVGKVAAEALLKGDAEVAKLPEVSQQLTEVAQKTGENVVVGKTARVQAPAGGKVGLYLYSITGKIGVLMAFTGNPSDELIKSIGGHIAFARPVGLTREEVPSDLVTKERELAVEQAKATGKPQQIAEKIAEGKMNAFFGERVLLDQEFYNAQVFKGTIAAYTKQAGVSLTKYVRLEVGQA